jgi:hypothetical protein
MGPGDRLVVELSEDRRRRDARARGTRAPVARARGRKQPVRAFGK